MRTGGDLQTVTSGVVAFDSAATILTFAVTRPVKIHRVFAIASIANTGTDCIMQVDVTRTGVATAVSPSGADFVGKFTGADNTVGTGWYKEAADFTQGEPILVIPGEAASVTVATAATAGDGVVGFEYEELPFVDSAFVRKDSAGANQTGTMLQYMTKVTS